MPPLLGEGDRRVMVLLPTLPLQDGELEIPSFLHLEQKGWDSSKCGHIVVEELTIGKLHIANYDCAQSFNVPYIPLYR